MISFDIESLPAELQKEIISHLSIIDKLSYYEAKSKFLIDLDILYMYEKEIFESKNIYWIEKLLSLNWDNWEKGCIYCARYCLNDYFYILIKKAHFYFEKRKLDYGYLIYSAMLGRNIEIVDYIFKIHNIPHIHIPFYYRYCILAIIKGGYNDLFDIYHEKLIELLNVESNEDTIYSYLDYFVHKFIDMATKKKNNEILIKLHEICDKYFADYVKIPSLSYMLRYADHELLNKHYNNNKLYSLYIKECVKSGDLNLVKKLILENEYQIETVFDTAVIEGYFYICKYITDEFGIKIEDRLDGFAEKGDLKSLKKYISHVNNYETLLASAANDHNFHIVKFLTKHHKYSQKTLNNALKWSIMKSFRHQIRYFISLGAVGYDYYCSKFNFKY